MCHSFHICTYVLLLLYGVHTYDTFTLQSLVANSWASCQQIVVKSGESETTRAWVADELGKSVEGVHTDYFVRSKYNIMPFFLPSTSINHIYASHKFPHNLTQITPYVYIKQS